MAMPTNKTIENKGLLSFSALCLSAPTLKGTQWINVPKWQNGFAPDVMGDNTTKMVLNTVVKAAENQGITTIPVGFKITREALEEILALTMGSDELVIPVGEITLGNANLTATEDALKELFGEAVVATKVVAAKKASTLTFLDGDDTI